MGNKAVQSDGMYGGKKVENEGVKKIVVIAV